MIIKQTKCKIIQNNQHSKDKAVNTTCLQTKIYIRPNLKKIPYELWKGRKPNISYFHPRGSLWWTTSRIWEWDHVQYGTVDLHFVLTDDQLVDIFTKPLTEERLILLRNQLGMIFIDEWYSIYIFSTVASEDLSSNDSYHT